MIHKIESEIELKQWCQEVNSGDHKHFCDLQDVYARSEERIIKNIFLSQPMNEKELTIFCVQKAMGAEKIFRLMRAWARQQAQIVIDDNDKMLNERFTELNEARRNFELEKTVIETQNKGYRDQIETQADLLERAQNQMNKLEKDNSALYLKCSEMETELEEAYKENKKHTEFQDYIRITLTEKTI